MKTSEVVISTPIRRMVSFESGDGLMGFQHTGNVPFLDEEGDKVSFLKLYLLFQSLLPEALEMQKVRLSPRLAF